MPDLHGHCTKADSARIKQLYFRAVAEQAGHSKASKIAKTELTPRLSNHWPPSCPTYKEVRAAKRKRKIGVIPITTRTLVELRPAKILLSDNGFVIGSLGRFCEKVQ